MNVTPRTVAPHLALDVGHGDGGEAVVDSVQQHPEVDQEDDPGLPQQPGVQGGEHAGDSTEHETESKLALMNSSINNIRLYLYFSF